MKGLLLAGGLGTRLRPLTYTGNKHTIPIANKPMILYALENLINAGIREINVILGPLKEGIVNIIGDGSAYNVKVNYIEQPDPLGLAHAVMLAENKIGNDSFVMHLGDNLLKGGIKEFVKTFEETNADAVIGVTKVKDPRQYGVVVLDDKGKVAKLIEKPKEPPSNLALVGVYVFSPKIFRYVKMLKPSWRGEYEITDAIQLMVNDGLRVEAIEVKGWWKDTGKPDDLLDANRLILDEIETNVKVNTDAKIEGRVVIEEETKIKENVVIRGPAIIGKNCVIGPNVYIGPYTSIGDNCVLRDVEIEDSIVMKDVKIEGVNYRISDSIIGNNVTITHDNRMPKSYKLIVGDRSQIIL
ncbi:glucose-1-phosphate thymidylyltransferase [Acidianus sulfidivorans JP7]|uniref:Glucose-1-phosphate thymidylyltransferase n=1 Tax=Acidianus sulfidivorans JP7 TaxID=619593 RepID=A0A2U9IJM3_9CREN|nr:glucose-1-phosphate thymidylyltransferase [Acidianus sulfidivorans]AWR96238.1 glucose-1-phosphate thymidylyltransferase [Acidianus sulfidivorans JP7]